MDTTVQQNIDLLRTAFAHVQAHDLDAAQALLTDEFIANQPGATEPQRSRELWAANTAAMLKAFPDLTITIHDIFGAADKVAVRTTCTATHQGPFAHLAPTHRPVHYTSLELYRFENSRIAEEWVAPDLTTLFNQLTAD
ncbi:ester cyclase [Kribbella sandramycini]|uniref:Ester cyclase n=1 Tax=Kribbella sandramycini TaxID=60450 RepID=A0A7Y4L3S4_9ACTN|nr:ester cyclase [Kribbella sandramycini]MBB6570701.1 putative ester cyclase [Kribbella sandramycini]NOL43845.1 ester cyclase [Kribbella sandramycini]